jgi:hypothetical protein
MGLEEAVQIVLATDVATLVIWNAADRAHVSTRELTEELHRRGIIDADAVQFVKKLTGIDYERKYPEERRI